MLSRAIHPFRRTILALVFLFSLLAATAARGQDGSIIIDIDRPEDIGLEGHIRPGTWATIKLTLRNNLPSIRKLSVDWISPDVDGDLVIARRENVVVNPNGNATVRLYAMPAVNARHTEGWTVRVVDAETDQVVAARMVTVARQQDILQPKVGVIGITGNGLAGLDAFRDTYTQHEQLEMISGLDPALLPDRWYGLRLLDALVWTPTTSRSPADPSVPMAAIREWVRRGGHLVIILSAVDTGWSDPKLADLLPPVKIGEATEISTPPLWLYQPSDPEILPATTTVQGLKFTLRPFTRKPDAKPGDAALITPGNVTTGGPEPEHTVVAAHQYGFGRVTLIGLDITNSRNLSANSAFSEYGLRRLWQTVFGWRSPANLRSTTLIDERLMVPLHTRDSADLTSFIPGRISMKTTAAATLFAAVLLFGVYWVVAGPGMFGALKAKGMLHHSWLIFGGIVLVFSAFTWLAAFFLRPGMTEIEHFSIVDIDATSTGPAQIRSQSYFSLFIPKHGTIDIAIDSSKDRPNHNTLSSAGLPGADRGSFVDERRYTINTLAVSATPGVPVRSTAKQFEAQYCDILDTSSFAQRWMPPLGKLKLKYDARGNGWPTGDLTHSLPGTLTNVRVFYCEGDGAMPVYGKYPAALSWAAGTPLSLLPPEARMDLVVPPGRLTGKKSRLKMPTTTKQKANGWEGRTLNDEGYLGVLVGKRSGSSNEPVDDKGRVVVEESGSATVDKLETITFFNMLPPPNFMEDLDTSFTSFGSSTVHLNRSVARSADLTHLTAARRVIIVGHLERNSPIPVPIKVDGDEPDSNGWTMVRFVLPVEE